MPAIKVTKAEKLSRMFKSRRVEMGYTQHTVAKYFGVSQATIVSWEKNPLTLRVDTFLAYCQYLRIPKQNASEALFDI